jgi:microcystin-dependent protein
MWSGLLAAIPAGWALCNGANGTPDLRDRFIRGAAAGANPGATGGSATHGHTATGAAVADHVSHTHTYAQVINHTHTIVASNTAGTSGTSATRGAGTQATVSAPNPTGGVATGTTAGPSATLSHSVTQPTIGDGSSLPPFYALAFIQRIA